MIEQRSGLERAVHDMILFRACPPVDDGGELWRQELNHGGALFPSSCEYQTRKHQLMS